MAGIIKKTAAAAASAMLMLTLTACAEKENEKAHNWGSPAAEAGDERFELPIAGLYKVTPADIDEEAAKRVCKAAGKEYTPETIDSIWFGENVFGIGLASVVYFGKYASEMSETEWAELEKIAAAPESYSAALSGGKTDSELIVPQAGYASRIPDNAYFDAMTEQIVCDIVSERKCSRNEAFRLLYSEGVTIETPYLPSMQKAVDEVYGDNSSFSADGGNFPQSACAVCGMNGEMLAIAAGNNGNTAYNRAYRTLHRIGSAIKPIAVYTPALKSKMINFSSTVMDMPINNDGAGTEWPRNYDYVYEGAVTVTHALRQSKNTVPVRIAEKLGADKCCDFLRNDLGFTTLTEEDATVSAMALGYLDRGVSMTELAASYQIFGNGGSYTSPSFYTKVTDADGKVIIERKSETEQVIDSADSWIMNRLLYYNICKEDGIAAAARLSDGSEVCGKTGTVDDDNGGDTDRLFVGLTPEYSAAVWIGYDTAGARIDRTNYKLPAEVWKNIMERADRSVEHFASDSGVTEADYCTESGELAGEKCPSVEKGYYRANELPEKCSKHK